jgi:phytoene dehydrogenase-like protein
MSKGVYIFQGGTDLMISMMRDELIKNNVDIQLQAKVDEVIISDKKVQGVVVKGHKIFSKAVVSNANLKTTVEKMIGKNHLSESFFTQSKEVRLNTSSCQVYMGLKKGESFPFIGDLIFTSDDREFSTELLLSPKVGSQTFSIYYPEMRPQNAPMYAIVSSSNARYEDYENLTEAEYEKQKEYLIERALSGIEKIVPGIRSKIEYVEAATPLTFKRYTLHEKGSSFGTKFEGLEVSMNLHKEISGMFHAGSVGIIMSGWLGAANYGVIVAHEVDNYLSQLEKDQSHLFTEN